MRAEFTTAGTLVHSANQFGSQGLILTQQLTSPFAEIYTLKTKVLSHLHILPLGLLLTGERRLFITICEKHLECHLKDGDQFNPLIPTTKFSI